MALRSCQENGGLYSFDLQSTNLMTEIEVAKSHLQIEQNVWVGHYLTNRNAGELDCHPFNIIETADCVCVCACV